MIPRSRSSLIRRQVDESSARWQRFGLQPDEPDGIAMRIAACTARTVADVHLMPISDCEWRVSDARVSRESSLCLIGFISLSRGKYEVLEFGDPMRIFFVSSMARAKSKFVTPAVTLPKRDQRSLDERLERVLPAWAHGQLGCLRERE
jgi:hypothetical protein